MFFTAPGEFVCEFTVLYQLDPQFIIISMSSSVLGPCELAGYTSTCCDHTSSDCQGVQDSEVCHCDTECELHGDCCVDFDLICK